MDGKDKRHAIERRKEADIFSETQAAGSGASLSQPPPALGSVWATLRMAIPRGAAWDGALPGSDAAADSEQVGEKRRPEPQGEDGALREAAMVGEPERHVRDGAIISEHGVTVAFKFPEPCWTADLVRRSRGRDVTREELRRHQGLGHAAAGDGIGGAGGVAEEDEAGRDACARAALQGRSAD